ncbi:MAG: hypothetical protein M1819_006717 [Sarea resinae]|nr:MAG: hypothetical protein M1819_006717 [Sarea resinae]
MDAVEKSKAQSPDELAASLESLGISDLPQYPNSYPTLNPVDIYRVHITEHLAAITGVDPKIIYPALQWTQTLDKGDLTLPVPALRVKGAKPNELAAQWGEKFPETPLVAKPTVNGAYLQFYFKPEALAKLVLPSILKSTAAFGLNPHNGLKDPSDPSKGKKKIIVEFSSPNIAKPFHAGHLRSTIIGGFLSNLYEGAGWDVVRMNYLGDWGKQYGILAMGYEAFGDEAKLLENPIGHLYDVYVKINAIAKEEGDKIKAKKEEILATQGKNEDVTEQEVELAKMQEESVDERARKYFKRMEDGDEEALATWRKFRDLSIERYKQTYSRLNIHYDDYSGESQVKAESLDKVSKIMEETGVSEESEGAVIVDLTKHAKKLGKAIVKKKDGTSLYLTRDIGAAMERYDKYHFDKMIYVVASQQDLHLAQLFKIEELMGRKDISEKCQHITFGLVLGMSTRKGTAKFLDDILRDVGDKMHEVMRANQAKYEQVENPDQVADTLGISSVMVQDMSGKRINNYEFSLSRMTSFEGDTGPYLQYAHARLCSIHRRYLSSLPTSSSTTTTTTTTTNINDPLLSANLSLLTEPHAHLLIRSLAQYPDVVQNALKTHEPVTILTYLFKMTHLLSSSYDVLKVVGSEDEVRAARMAVFAAARQVLWNGMVVLGLSPVERM